jgi:hypothetical protein
MRRAYIPLLLAAAVAAAGGGCSDDAPGAPDAGDTDGGIDGGGSGGLRLTWQATPAPTAEIRADLTVDKVHLSLRDVRCIGDAAPGDSRTWRAALELEWNSGNAPAPLVFDDAPPGIYSSFELRLDGNGEEGYELEGTVLHEGEWSRWKVEDSEALSVSLPLEVRLEVGGVVTIPIDLDLAAVLGPINWEEVEGEEDTIEIGNGDPQLPAIRQRLVAAFSVGALLD